MVNFELSILTLSRLKAPVITYRLRWGGGGGGGGGGGEEGFFITLPDPPIRLCDILDPPHFQLQ